MKHMPERVAKARLILFATWILLVGLTIGSVWLSESDNLTSIVVTRVTLGAALLKGHLIAGIYMEMRDGPIAWALAMSGFLVFQTTLLVVILP